MKATLFSDMYSGGFRSNNFDYGYIVADEETAIEQFSEQYGSPFSIGCECCGSNYSVIEFDSLEELLSYRPEAVKLEAE